MRLERPYVVVRATGVERNLTIVPAAADSACVGSFAKQRVSAAAVAVRAWVLGDGDNVGLEGMTAGLVSMAGMHLTRLSLAVGQPPSDAKSTLRAVRGQCPHYYGRRSGRRTDAIAVHRKVLSSAASTRPHP